MAMEKSSFSMGVFSQVFPEFQKIDVSFNISMFPGGSSYLRQYIHIYIYIYSGCGFQIISFVELSWAENSTKIIQNRCDRLKGKYYYLIK